LLLYNVLVERLLLGVAAVVVVVVVAVLLHLIRSQLAVNVLVVVVTQI
jgi:hypothetical protein